MSSPIWPHSTKQKSSGQLVKEEIDGDDLAVPGDQEIRPGISRWFARAAGYPADPSTIAPFLRRGERLIFEVRVSGLDHACDAMDLIVATVDSVGGIVEHGIFVEDLRDRGAATVGIVLAEDVVEITHQ